jgi:stage V sporulation protein SpoVS
MHHDRRYSPVHVVSCAYSVRQSIGAAQLNLSISIVCVCRDTVRQSNSDFSVGPKLNVYLSDRALKM